MGLVFTIIWAGYEFNLVIPIEAYLILIIVFIVSVALFVIGCRVKKQTFTPPSQILG